MCIIALAPENITIPKEHLQQSFLHNDDGAGFMYAEDDQLHIEKGFMDFDSFYTAYKPHEEKPIAVHFRITTHGDSDQGNTHPFQVGKNLAFVHNGIINAVERPDKTKSDTYWFNQKILVPVYKRDSRFIFKDHFKELVKEYIGHSKLVFLNNKGHHTIVNEKMGVWDEGVWYSNGSYKPRQVAQRQAERQRITPVKESEQDLFSVGDRVKIEYEFNKANNGFGVIKYFGNGQMVGVQMEGTSNGQGNEAIRLIHMSFVYPAVAKNAFKKDDWVVRRDDEGTVGEVQGTIGSGVVVRWLGGTGMFVAPDYVVNADKLEYWHSYQGDGQ